MCPVLLQRTDKATNELKPGVRTLGLRERSVLLMVKGTKAIDELAWLCDGEGKEVAIQLVADGFLISVSKSGVAVSSPAPSSPSPSPSHKQSMEPVSPNADSFEGKRSMATTRMFLFDICERMFARRSPELASEFREALRNAKDRESMLDASRRMIDEIERIAGHERADSISERIAMLMPPEAVAS